MLARLRAGVMIIMSHHFVMISFIPCLIIIKPKEIMKKYIYILFLALVLIVNGCSLSDSNAPDNAISKDITSKIAALGFSTEKIIKTEFGYIVEGDILLTENDLNSAPAQIRIPQAEQYHTFNLVRAPRVITVRVFEGLPAIIGEATDIAIDRYNAENLALTFQRTDKRNADIVVLPSQGGGFLAFAGFPDKRGNPYGYVRVNTLYMNENANLLTLASVMAHEIGHCIGFRHTDWFNRSYSCGAGGSEGEETTGVGAVHIPGTPTGPDAESWMLSCIPFFSGVDRPFTAADKVALDYLY